MSIKRLTTAEFQLLAPRLVDIHLEAMGYPFELHARRLESWRRDTLQPGFISAIATGPNDVVGVAYGFLSDHNHWWDRQLRKGMEAQGVSEELQREISSGYFEVTEIHVRPGLHGRGIGRSLLTELLWNVPAPRAVLSTPEVAGENNPAFGLYRSLGFTDLLRDYYYPGDDRPFAVLMCDLPLATPRA